MKAIINAKKASVIFSISILIILCAACATTQPQADDVAPDAFQREEARRLHEEGVRFNMEQKYDKAIASFAQAIQVYPSFQRAYNSRGITYFHIGRHLKAIQDFNYAISLGSQDIEEYVLGYFLRGTVFSALGEYEKAVEDFSLALRLVPFLPMAHHGRAVAFYHLGNLRDAIIDANLAVTFEPQNYRHFYSRGRIFYGMGFLNLALEDFRSSLRLNQSNALAAVNAGTILKELGQYESSLELFDLAISIDPDLSLAYFRRAVLFIRLGESTIDMDRRNEYFQKAEADFERSL